MKTNEVIKEAAEHLRDCKEFLFTMKMKEVSAEHIFDYMIRCHGLAEELEEISKSGDI